ncbi:hypothetical protein [Deinococcus ruber]|uniref:Uncharacterized protein n=1 Tax=Deinococcus ruber TaxID=1848197 RepID=A0A918CLY9_9DEIO|nr:hypothetical protein [Deinococcus ruber]GGR31402.1 hypothetical protein GCM10008957_47640 [Deinococcus ruber]
MTDAERLTVLEQQVADLTEHLNRVTALVTTLVEERNATLEALAEAERTGEYGRLRTV